MLLCHSRLKHLGRESKLIVRSPPQLTKRRWHRMSYLFWAVFTIVRTSCTISSSLSWSLLLAASTKQQERWSSRSWRLVDLTSQMTAKFCWMTEIQYLSFSIISITLSNVLLAFFRDINTFCWFFFIVWPNMYKYTYGVGIVEFWGNAREFYIRKNVTETATPYSWIILFSSRSEISSYFSW